MSSDIVELARRRRAARDPALQQASEKLARITLCVHACERGSPERLIAESARNWWLAKVQSLNPGGAEIIPFPAPSREVRQ